MHAGRPRPFCRTWLTDSLTSSATTTDREVPIRTTIEVVLTALAALMLLRQLTLIGTLAGLVARFGRVRIELSFWAHLGATAALITAWLHLVVGL